eukprot:scaffold55166_cov30-Tisochrysis_lutea.AAC.7
MHATFPSACPSTRSHMQDSLCLARTARQEYACTAVDVLARRTRLAFLDANAAVESLPRVIELMARELKWSSKRKEQASDEHAVQPRVVVAAWVGEGGPPSRRVLTTPHIPLLHGSNHVTTRLALLA